MSSLWQMVKDEVRLQLNEFRAFIALAGTTTDGLITIQRITEGSAGSERFARVAGFPIDEGDEVVCLIVGGKPLILGRLQRTAMLDFGNPVPHRFPLGIGQDPAGPQTAMVSNASYASYMGKADAAYTTINLRVSVNTAAATITWAEVGIGTSPTIALNGAASITRRGFTSVATAFNSTGEKSVAVTVSGINPGDHLWALFGSQATTPYQLVEAAPDYQSSGLVQFLAATRISTMASPTAFGVSGNSDNGADGYWIGA